MILFAAEIFLLSNPGNYKNIIKHLNKDNVTKAIEEHGRLVIHTESTHSVLANLLRALENSHEELRDIRVNEPSLKEAFNYLVRKEG